jgi:hypothetical protein
MSGSTSVPLSADSHAAFITYYTQLQDMHQEHRSSLRSRMQQIDKLYQRELDTSEEHLRAKAANEAGDSKRFQNITVPVVAPQVETAVTYQASVFLTGYPLLGVVSDPKFMDEAMQLETLIEDNSIRGGWTRELLMFFRNGFKYNFAPLEVSWGQEKTTVISTDLIKNPTEGIPTEVLWAGNKLRTLDPYNVFVDHRVLPTEVYKKGEFAGFTESMSRMELKQFIQELPDKITVNIKAALESGYGSAGAGEDAKGLYTPIINPDINLNDVFTTGTNWLSWAGLSSMRRPIEYKDSYEKTVLYARILPSEFSLAVPNRNIPQIYKLIIINHKHIIYCERQTNAHNYIPILIGQPLEDGLGYQTKSLAKNAEPFQHVASAFMNSIMHSRRRAVTDRVLYDPSRITSAHINSDNPSAKIPVRPAAYGKNIGEAVYQFPYREDQAGTSMQQIQQMIAMSNSLSGQNAASQGQFVKGNKTLQEFDSVMQNANGRDQMASILIEAQVFVPMKHIIKTNVLQYQGGTSIYNREKQVAVEIDPIKLRQAVMEFKISDGLIPSSKLINAESYSVALQVLGSSPEIGAAYNIAPLFSYMMKTQGAKIADFEKSQEQMAYEQAVGSWQQVVLEAMKIGIDAAKLPPQPKPEEFGYNPNGNKPAGQTTDQPTAANIEGQ